MFGGPPKICAAEPDRKVLHAKIGQLTLENDFSEGGITYLHAYDSVSYAKNGLGKYFTKYNQRRPYPALDDKAPDEFYFDNLPALLKAA